ncbi:uncharacterized protein OCT59_029051 [Rhizophagus irregularis]|uniref:uncharacterized protein n=1 Tax=Rhizophagus irregularis TaxID=588596 RepID=UPI00332B06C4|nr:hypothetical protein OCT59_029051 [Rhizophagus irregularis]
MILNDLTGPDYVYSRKSTDTPGIPDFNCHLVGSLILVMEAKRKHVLEDMGEQTFPEFYQTSKGKDVVQQIYNYMGGNELRYGILSTYDNHWFLLREHTELRISKTLPLQSETPPVLKAYAYLTRRAKENPKSPKPQVLVPAHGDNNSRNLRSHSKSTSSSSIDQQSTSGTFANQQSSSNIPVNQQKFSFADFKFKGILGEGRSGKTLLCEFRGDTIALKSVDLSKAPSYVLKEMQKEVEIYKELADIQGKYIPKLVCYGYYGGGMSFVIGMTIVGTSLSDQKIKKQQKTRAIKGLEAIHKHGILHNDIREENILINDDGGVYLIDFGMASREDTKKKRKLFEEEQLKYSNLLDRYNTHFVKKEGRISKSRKCQVTHESGTEAEEKEMDSFLLEAHKKIVSSEIKQRNKEKKLSKAEQASLNQDQESDTGCSTSEKILEVSNPVTKISAGAPGQNSHRKKGAENIVQLIADGIKDDAQSSDKAIPCDVISIESLNQNSSTDSLLSLAQLFDKADDAEYGAIRANQEEILRWYYYGKEFLTQVSVIVQDGKGKIGEKKAKGIIYDKMLEHLSMLRKQRSEETGLRLPEISRKNLQRKTQKAVKIYIIFEKIS